MKDKQPNKSLHRAVSFLSQIGVTMISCVFVGVFLGKFLDSRLRTTPWLLLVFSLLGVGAALKSFFDLANGK